MKKTSALFLVALTGFFLFGCTSTNQSSSQQQSVVTGILKSLFGSALVD